VEGRSVTEVDVSVLDGDPDVRGSVQEMYRLPDGDRLLARSLDGGSVFDVGQFFRIPGSGAARNTLRHQVYVELGDPATWQALGAEELGAVFQRGEDVDRLLGSEALTELRVHGARTHHLGLVDPRTGRVAAGRDAAASDVVLIREFPVVKPSRERLVSEHVYDYVDYLRAPSKVMALEHIVRLGVPGGSSLLDRHRRLVAAGDEAAATAFVTALGLAGTLEPWTALPSPSVEWTTKYEDHDRPLSRQEAALLGGVHVATLAKLVDLLLLATTAVTTLFRRAGLRLWDLKWEVADDGGAPVLVDTMDHDSARITAPGELEGVRFHVHFNKQAVRDYYRILHPDWHQALDDAKQRSVHDERGRGFIDIYRDGVAEGRYPATRELDPAFAGLQGEKYWYVTEASAGAADRSRSADLAVREARFYDAAGAADAFLRRNATP